MKKVLFTATVDSHILQFHLPFLKLFKEKGYEVHVATNGDEEIPYCDVKHKVCFERSPFKLNNLKAIKQLKKICNKEKFEIIHTHTPMGATVTRIAARSSRKKHHTRVIYTAHGLHFFKGAPIINWLLFYPVEKYLSKYTDTLILINQEDYDLCKRKFKKCKDIQYVPGVGIDEEKFNFKMTKKEKLELRKSLGLKENDFVMIYPAELSKRKRQTWLINSIEALLKKHKDIHLLLPGKDSLNGECQELVKKLDLEKQIHFLGYRKDIPKLLKISDISLSAANQEGLPVNIMEAMYIGLPIIATDCRGNRDLVKDGLNGYLIELDDKRRFSKCIDVLYNHTNDEFTKKCKLIIKNYLLDRILEIIKKIYMGSDYIMNLKEKILIIPTCTDFNRGDQALVLETKKIIDKVYQKNECYMMSTGETTQCEAMGMKTFTDILKHPSRFDKNKDNIKYNSLLKIKWGIVAVFDYLISVAILCNFTRKIVYPFLRKETKKSLRLYKESSAIFVKGGGFLHDYSKGLIGIYTIYYQLYHIKLALAMEKKVFIMPNSFGPFANKNSMRMVNKVLDRCSLVTARESISASKDLNTLNRKIDLYPDLAFFLDERESKYDLNTLFTKYNINDKTDKLVAITVRPYRFYSYANPEQKYNDYKNAFVNFINYLTSKKYKVLLVVHTRAENEHENDESCIDDIIKMIDQKSPVYKIKDDKMNCYDLKKLYGKCKYVIGTRFHSVIFSMEQLIPCIAITYGGNKGDGIMKDINLTDYSIKIGELDSEKLIETFEKMILNESKIVEKIKFYLEQSKNKYNELICFLKNNK